MESPPDYRRTSDVPEFLAHFTDRVTPLKLRENAHENADSLLIQQDAIEVEANKLR